MKGVWTQSEKMLIFRKMHGDVWQKNIFQGAEVIDLYLRSEKTAIGTIVGSQVYCLRVDNFESLAEKGVVLLLRLMKVVIVMSKKAQNDEISPFQ